MPDFRALAVDVKQPGEVTASATKHLGMLLAEVMKLNKEERNFPSDGSG